MRTYRLFFSTLFLYFGCEIRVRLLLLDRVQRAQTSAKAKISTKSDPGFASGSRINPDLDPDICQIAHKMLRIQYNSLVGVSHFPSVVKTGQ